MDANRTAPSCRAERGLPGQAALGIVDLALEDLEAGVRDHRLQLGDLQAVGGAIPTSMSVEVPTISGSLVAAASIDDTMT